MRSVVKWCVIYILRFLMRVIYIFPIKNNRIVFNSYSGRQYSCNPKYITEYLMCHYPNKYDIIWAFRDIKKFSYLKERGVKIVKYSSLKRFYYEATAKISINNIGSFSWFPVRENQEHINTWHGGYHIKKVGLQEDTNDNLMKKSIQASTDWTTALISTSRTYDQVAANKDLGFHRETLHIGYPRNDIIFRQKNHEVDLKAKVCDWLGISVSNYLILYAPTYRERSNLNFVNPDYQKIREVISDKLGVNVTIISRMHHFMKQNIGSDITVDGTDYPDMQELLAVSDILITDYSSCIWDYAITKRPIYIYAPDFQDYSEDRGYHVNPSLIGFSFAKTNEELIANMLSVDDKIAENQANKFLEKNGSYENGNACKKIYDYMLEKGLSAHA